MPLILSTPVETNIQVSGITTKSSKYQEANRVHFGNKLKFVTHIESICKKFNRKLNALARVTPFMNLSKWKIN